MIAITSVTSIALNCAARACERRRQYIRRKLDRKFHMETDVEASVWFLDAPLNRGWDSPRYFPARTERPQETHPRDRVFAARTTEMLRRYRQRPQGGSELTSGSATPDPADNLFPRDAGRAFPVQIIKPAV